jgi:hypothetical protein
MHISPLASASNYGNLYQNKTPDYQLFFFFFVLFCKHVLENTLMVLARRKIT